MGLAPLKHIVRGETELSPRKEEGDLVNVPLPGGDRPQSLGQRQECSQQLFWRNNLNSPGQTSLAALQTDYIDEHMGNFWINLMI